MIKRIKNSPFAMNSLALFAGSMTGSILSYIFQLVVGRMVDVSTYGEVQSLSSLFALIAVPAITISMVAAKFTAQAKAAGDKAMGRSVFLYLNTRVVRYGIPFFALSALLSPFIANFLKINSVIPVIIILLSMLVLFFSSVSGGMVIGWQKFRSSGIAAAWGALAKLVGGVALVALGLGVNGVVGGMLIGTVMAYVVTLFAIRFIFKKDEDSGVVDTKFDFGDIRRYVLPALVANIAITIMGNADMVLAKHNLDLEAAGQYGALSIVGKIIFFATSAIATVLFSMSSEKHHKQGNTKRVFWYAALLMLVLSAVAIAIYFTVPKLVLSALFGGKYVNVAEYLGWFAVVVTLFSLANLLLQYLLSVNKTGAAYEYLVASLIMILVILWKGTSIPVILAIVGATQVLGIIFGLRAILVKQS